MNNPPMTFIEHLGALRQVIIYSLILLATATIGTLFFSAYFMALIKAPLEAQDATVILMSISPAEVVVNILKIAVAGGIYLSLPFIIYQLWHFVAPGLTRSETKIVLPSVVLGSICFTTGSLLAFNYFIPLVLRLLLSTNSLYQITASWSLDAYVTFCLNILIISGLICEMPIVFAVLSRLGIINYRMICRARSYAFLGIFITAAATTPPDIFSQLALALPMLLLFELSIQIVRIAEPQKEDPYADLE